MIPNEREIYLMNAINEKNDKYWGLRQEIEQEKKRRAILVMAGIAADRKWDIDLTKIKIKFVNSLEPFLVSDPLHFDMANPPSLYRSRTPVDNMIFQSDNGTRWRKDNIEFWLAWGPVTNTLAIAILQRKDEIVGCIDFEY